MNNTTTKRNLALAAVFMAVILVVGTFATTTTITTTQSAFAYLQKKKGGGHEENSRNGNTITIQKCKQAAIQSGFDNQQEEECGNLICTHPGENATCTQEGAAVAPTTTTANDPCVECFKRFLNTNQINEILSILEVTSPADLCTQLKNGLIDPLEFVKVIEIVVKNPDTVDNLIVCLQEAGVLPRA